MIKRKLNAKERELQASWDALKKEQSKPVMDKKKFGPSSGKKRLTAVADVLNRNADRLPSKYLTAVKPDYSVGLDTGSTDGIGPPPAFKMDPEEYARREAAAREVKHCVMPLHKGAYILVTDAEMVKQMGKKTA